MPRIRENFFNQIKQFRHLTDIILIPQNFKSTGESSNLQNCRSMRFLPKYISSMPFPELFVLPERSLPSSYKKLWDKRWYFAISGAVFGNVINSNILKCGAQNVIRFKEQPNKKKFLTRAFPRFYMQCGCRK